MAAKIECPKCGFRQDEGTECLQCGVIFDRIRPSTDIPVPEQSIDYDTDSDTDSGRSVMDILRRGYRIFRWVSLCAFLIIVTLILYDSPPPEVETNPEAIQQAENKVRKFQSTIRQGRQGTLELDESELNGWLDTNLVLQAPDDSASSHSPEQDSEIHSINSALEEYEFDEAAIEEAKSSMRDIRVELRDDTLRVYVVFDTHGIDLSLELEGRIRVENGYLRLDPVGGKLGSLPLPSGTLQSATTKLFESPENRDKFRLPPHIRDMKISGGQLVVFSQEIQNTLR